MSVGSTMQRWFQTLVQRARGTGVGTEDPNIVGDAGPVDVPPGRDPDTGGGLVVRDPDPGADHVET
jgi:hypothetical protein